MLIQKFYLDFKDYTDYKKLNKEASARKFQEFANKEDLK